MHKFLQGQQCTFTGLMHEIMQTPKSAINADQDYLGMSRDILHTPAGFEVKNDIIFLVKKLYIR